MKLFFLYYSVLVQIVFIAKVGNCAKDEPLHQELSKEIFDSKHFNKERQSNLDNKEKYNLENIATKNKTKLSYEEKEMFIVNDDDNKSIPSPIRNVTVTSLFNETLQIVQLNISWHKSEDSCAPLYYDFIVSPLPTDVYCSPHNYMDSYQENGNITNILLPYYLHTAEIEPGCSYTVEISAHCSGEIHVEKNNHTTPECVGSVCKCIDLSPKIDKFEINQLSSNFINISWEIDDEPGARKINNVTHIDFSYRSIQYEETIKHKLQFAVWLTDVQKITNQSYVVTSIENFQNNYNYEIQGKFQNNYSCTTNVYDKYFAVVKAEFSTEKMDVKYSWFKIPVALIIFSTIMAFFVFYFRKKSAFLNKLFRITSRQTSNHRRQIVLNAINPLYQEQPLVRKEGFVDTENDPFEFPRSNLKIIKFLNGGQFGEVHFGKAFEIAGKSEWTYVAVKTTKDIYTKSEISDDLLEEIKILKKVTNHPHIVSLLGCCTRQHPFLILMEFVPCGSLKEYLMELRKKWDSFRKRRTESDSVFNEGSDCNYICPDSPGLVYPNRRSYKLPSTSETVYTNLSEGTNSTSPTTPVGHFSMEYLLDHEELSKFSLQIAKGMAHLEKLGVTHRDLAARNILMDEFRTLKITDFGLSRHGTYVVMNKIKLPIRWMAIESIRDLIFNNKTDVWSFAVVLWEIGTLGALPYKEVPDELLINHIVTGNILSRPQICTDELFSLMLRCWSGNPDERPTFEELVEIQTKKQSEAYIDFSLLNPGYMFPPTD